MGRKYDFKYIVIGGGPAGTAAALTLAKAKKRVGLIEGGAYGGAHLNTRDVPFAVTLDFAHTYYRMLRLPEFNRQEFSISFPSIVAHQLKAVVEAGGGNHSKIADHPNLICIHGFANFLDDHTVAVGDRQFSAETFILATGAKPDHAGLQGLEAVNYLTPETALKIRRLPQAALIVGGGSAGCEIAEYYATLGAKTLLMEKSNRLLPREDPEVGQLMFEHLSEDLGVLVLTGSKAKALSQDTLSKFVVFETDHTEKMVRVDCIVLATGSQPNFDFGLDNTGVKLTKTGTLKIDHYFQTTAKHIYAIGDCVNAAASTEQAEYEGRLVANNFTTKTRSTANYRGFIQLTKTLPAVASFGPTEAELKRAKIKYKKAVVQLADIPAGKIYRSRRGFVKLLANHNSRIIGGCLVSDHAEIMASEISLAIRHRLSALELASTPHPTNEFSYAIQLAARKLVTGQK